MADYIQSHINLFGAWDPKFTPNQVYDRIPGTDSIIDLIETVLKIKLENISVPSIERFAEISPVELYLPIVPDEQYLVDRLLRPLKSAKRLYCLEEFLATIALSGLVGESLVMLVYRMRKPILLNGQSIVIKQERQLFGRDFDSLDQNRRVEILRCFGLINDEQKKLFSDLRGIRNKYLHLWEVSANINQIQADAKKNFLNAMLLFKEISGLAIGEGGTLVMSPYLLEYLKAQKMSNVSSDPQSNKSP